MLAFNIKKNETCNYIHNRTNVFLQQGQLFLHYIHIFSISFLGRADILKVSIKLRVSVRSAFLFFVRGLKVLKHQRERRGSDM